MFSGKKIRSVLFYLYAAIFFSGLPFILSFALGHKFDVKNLKFKKAGLVSIKTYPAGANVYFNSRLLKEKTPVVIPELLPGEYRIRAELKGYYPWQSRVRVEAGKVTQLEKIILFSLRPNIKQLNRERVFSFWQDQERGEVYYLNREPQAVYIYKSDLEGNNPEEIAKIPEMPQGIKKWKVSPDRKMLACFNQRQVAVLSLGRQESGGAQGLPFISDFSNRRILDVFWHSDSYHLILVTDRTIEAIEAKPGAPAVILSGLNKGGGLVSYDEKKDALYFIDAQMAEDRKIYDNVYKLELGQKPFSFPELMKQEKNDE